MENICKYVEIKRIYRDWFNWAQLRVNDSPWNSKCLDFS